MFSTFAVTGDIEFLVIYEIRYPILSALQHALPRKCDDQR
jgi:hypothetical protein